MRIRHADKALMLLLGLVLARPADAHHVVWLDFGNFNLSQFPSVNGHAPTANDRTAIENLVFAEMQEDFALFDIHLVRYQPREGRYTRLRFHGNREAIFGCAEASCCRLGNCSGRRSWNALPVSSAEIYAGRLAGSPEFQGPDADTARIARALANTGSQQLGTILGLTSCHAAGNFVGSGSDPSVERTSCGTVSTKDDGRNHHIMASGSATGLTDQQLAERDLFFSVRSSRRTLYRQLQPRNHWQQVQSLDRDRRGDLLLHRFATPLDIQVTMRPSTGNSFGPSNTTLSSSAGDRGDAFHATGGGVVRARPLSGSSVEWRLLLPGGALDLLRSDAGDVGSIFRWASVRNTIASGKQDLFFGRFTGPAAGQGRFDWWVNPLGNDPFDPTLLGGVRLFQTVGSQDDLLMPGAVERSFLSTNDRTTDDLLIVLRDAAMTYVGAALAFIRTEFEQHQTPVIMYLGSNIPADYVFFADVDGDGDGDLVTGKVRSDTVVQWEVRANRDGLTEQPEGFDVAAKTTDDRGDAGCHFRMGDVDGDSRADLIIGNPVDRAGLSGSPGTEVVEWSVARSIGSTLLFGNEETWISDWGREGDVFP